MLTAQPTMQMRIGLCRMEPGHREEYVAYLRAQEQWGAAAAQLASCVNDDSFRSLEGKSKHALWLELCDIITKHPDEVRKFDLDVDAVIRSGIRKFPAEVGRLWCASDQSCVYRGCKHCGIHQLAGAVSLI